MLGLRLEPVLSAQAERAQVLAEAQLAAQQPVLEVNATAGLLQSAAKKIFKFGTNVFRFLQHLLKF